MLAGRQPRVNIVRQPEDTEWVTINADFVEVSAKHTAYAW